jgi:predicted transposase YdaD
VVCPNFSLPDTDLKQTRFYQEVFAEGRDEARRQTALNLLHQTSLDDAAIAAATDLDADAVRELRQASAASDATPVASRA